MASFKERIDSLTEDQQAAWRKYDGLVNGARNGRLSKSEVEECERLNDELDTITRQIALVRKEAGEEVATGALVGPDGRIGTSERAKMGFALRKEQKYTDLPGHTHSLNETDLREATGEYFRGLLNGDTSRVAPELRAVSNQSEGVTSQGGALVPNVLSAHLWDLARNATVLNEAGMQIVPADSAQLTLPVVEADATAQWIAEGATVPTDGILFRGITLRPQTLAVLVKANIQLVQDSAVDIGATIIDKVTKSMARTLDYAGFRGGSTGDGTAVPTGVFNTPSINSNSANASMSTFGAGTGWDLVLDSIYAVKKRNWNPTAIIMNPRDDQSLAKSKATNFGYVVPPPAALSIPRLLTNAVPLGNTAINQAPGAGGTAQAAGESEFYVGQWDQLVMVNRVGMTCLTLKEKYADQLQVGFVFFLRADFAVVNQSAFQCVYRTQA